VTNEERQRTMDFIVTQQAQFAVNCDKAEVRVSRLERIVKLIIKAGVRARTEMREQAELIAARMKVQFEAMRESQAHSDRHLDELRESQVHSDRRLDALIDIVREQRNGKS
jgi:hypothetical protein